MDEALRILHEQDGPYLRIEECELFWDVGAWFVTLDMAGLDGITTRSKAEDDLPLAICSTFLRHMAAKRRAARINPKIYGLPA